MSSVHVDDLTISSTVDISGTASGSMRHPPTLYWTFSPAFIYEHLAPVEKEIIDSIIIVEGGDRNFLTEIVKMVGILCY